MTGPVNAALIVIDAQQEYFAPLAEPVLTKHLPGSFTGTALETLLRERSSERVSWPGS